jgi:hypothetical protein
MRKDNQPIAALFGIVTNRIWYMFRIGYDETCHRIFPGHLIIENLLGQRAEQSSFDVLTPYNAPVWFRAWKPDKTLALFHVYVSTVARGAGTGEAGRYVAPTLGKRSRSRYFPAHGEDELLERPNTGTPGRRPSKRPFPRSCRLPRAF